VKKIMLDVTFFTLITGAVGLLISIALAFLIVISKTFFKYGTFRVFNELIVLGLGILGWYYIPKGILQLFFFLILSTLYQLYRIIRDIYSIDTRFRILVLALGKDRFEYAIFSIKRVSKRIIGSFFKYFAILIAAYPISQSLHAEIVGVISLLVGVILVLLKLD